MSLHEIDHDATLRRIDALTSGGLRALGEIRSRADEIDKAVDEMFEQRGRARQAIDEQVRQAAQRDKTPEPEPEKAKPKRTLSLGAEEFAEERAARQAPPASATPRSAATPRPAAPPTPEPGPTRPRWNPESEAAKSGRPSDPESTKLRRSSEPEAAKSRWAPESEVAQSRRPPESGAGMPRPASEPEAGKLGRTPEAEPGKPRRTLRLGAPEDLDEDPGTVEKPDAAAKRRDKPRPPATGDDDMSGRTWLR